MTLPRSIYLKEVAHTVRRTIGRKFRIQAIPKVANAVGYLISVLAARNNLTIHAAVAMLNHPHVALSDPECKRSDFMRDFHHFLTEYLNALQDREGPMWDERPPGNIVALDPVKAWDVVLYICLNPVAARLVKEVTAFPGFIILPKHWGKELTFKRPLHYFRKESWPDEATLVPMPPPGYEDMTIEEAASQAMADIRAGQKVYVRHYTSLGKGFIGSRRLAKIPIDASPKTFKSERGRLRPRWQASSQAIRERALEQERYFQTDYRRARERIKRGEKATFPEGTYFLREQNLAHCVPRRDLGWYRCLT